MNQRRELAMRGGRAAARDEFLDTGNDSVQYQRGDLGRVMDEAESWARVTGSISTARTEAGPWCEFVPDGLRNRAATSFDEAKALAPSP